MVHPIFTEFENTHGKYEGWKFQIDVIIILKDIEMEFL